MLLLIIRPTHLVGWRKVNVDSSSNKDTHSCVPDVSVFTCSLWERPDNVMESTQHSGRRAQQRHGVYYSHKGNVAVKFEALSSACQIVNETNEVCTAWAKKTKQSSTFYKSQLVASCSLKMYVTNPVSWVCFLSMFCPGEFFRRPGTHPVWLPGNVASWGFWLPGAVSHQLYALLVLIFSSPLYKPGADIHSLPDR